MNVRKRKMMLMLPVLVVPFVTMGFWALGGGKGGGGPVTENNGGLNLNLPGSNLKDDKTMDKLAFYDKAEKDSLKMKEWMRSDPYSKETPDGEMPLGNELEEITEQTASRYNQRLKVSPYEQGRLNPEAKVMERLAMLEKELAQPAAMEPKPGDPIYKEEPVELSGHVDRLESMMRMMTEGSGEDAEMKQLDGTLDKILDIQHPTRVRDLLQQKSVERKEQVFAVSREKGSDFISLLDTGKRQGVVSASFFGLDDEAEVNDEPAIEAVVHGNQVLLNGAVVKLRLLSDVFINGNLIGAGTFVSGIAELSNERLTVSIQSIRVGASLYPVKLEVYDMDGLAGIYIPGAIGRDVAKQSTDNSLQLLELSSMDPSLKAQAATAGIGAAKSLLSKKVKLVKVLVKAGYKVLLRDNNIEN